MWVEYLVVYMSTGVVGGMYVVCECGWCVWERVWCVLRVMCECDT